MKNTSTEEITVSSTAKIKGPGDDDSSDGEDFSSSGSSYNMMHHDHELFKDDDDIIQKMISVRLVILPRKSGEDWEVLEDKRVAFVLKGIRFTNPEKKFLKTAQGMKFVIEGYKNGWKAVSKFKQEMKRYI